MKVIDKRICCGGFMLMLCLLWTTTLLSTTLITGSGTMGGGGWRFHDTTTVHPDSSDIFMIIVALGTQYPQAYPYIVAANTSLGASITVVQDTTYADLTTAPPDDSTEYPYVGWLWAYKGATYVIKTQDNAYAKFHFTYLGPSYPVIEYAYQSDGTRLLIDTVSTDSSTWGAIKQLYRKE